MLLPSGGASFTWVGKAAPPLPTMPASATRFNSRAGSASCQSLMAGIGSWLWSSPSLSMISAGHCVPLTLRQLLCSLMTPLTGECMAADT